MHGCVFYGKNDVLCWFCRRFVCFITCYLICFISIKSHIFAESTGKHDVINSLYFKCFV